MFCSETFCPNKACVPIIACPNKGSSTVIRVAKARFFRRDLGFGAQISVSRFFDSKSRLFGFLDVKKVFFKVFVVYFFPFLLQTSTFTGKNYLYSGIAFKYGGIGNQIILVCFGVQPTIQYLLPFCH